VGYVGTVLMYVDENVRMRTFLEANRLCRYSLDDLASRKVLIITFSFTCVKTVPT
jgi:hypothetical protein